MLGSRKNRSLTVVKGALLGCSVDERLLSPPPPQYRLVVVEADRVGEVDEFFGAAHNVAVRLGLGVFDEFRGGVGDGEAQVPEFSSVPI